MIKKLLTILAVLSMLSTVAVAQWTNQGAWPDASLMGSGHGIAVDPDGKVWVTRYGTDDSLDTDPSVKVRTLRVYNADGTEADFSPIKTISVDGGFTVDTLFNSSRGLGVTSDGNILYSSFDTMYKIDYKTGEGLAKAVPAAGSTLTRATSDETGRVFVAHVLPDLPLYIYDNDLNLIEIAIPATKGFSRSFEVSADGNTIIWGGFTLGRLVIYNRPDEFSAYDSVGVVQGPDSESFAREPGTGYIWFCGGSYNDQPDPPFEPGVHYALDLSDLSIVDGETMQWAWTEPNTMDGLTERDRGLAFSPDGMTAYQTTFNNANAPLIQKFTKGAAAAVSVEFIVDMSYQVEFGLFDPATGTVSVAGTFNNWTPGVNALTDGDSDLKYSAVIEGFTPGDNIEFKFVKNADGWEGVDNRTYTVPDGGGTYEAYFDNFEGGTDISVTFIANIYFYIAYGIMDPANDVLTARGSMNGWSSDNEMTATVADPNIYEVTIDGTYKEGDVINYKFAYTHGAGVNWEGDPNKTYEITAADVAAGAATAGPRTFNDLTIETVLNQPGKVKFVCDMNGAVNNLTGTAFPEVVNVFIAGAVPPLSWPGGGWPDSDQDLVYFLNDDGGGMWSVELTFPIYSPLTIQYKYGANWGLASNGGANDNEAGVADDHFLSIPPYLYDGTVVNQFGVTGNHELTTDVKPVDSGIPTQYTLDQNYPNPFNPSTLIRFSVPQASNVTLKVYDMLGQEVATVLDEFKSAGSYEVNFDASQLTTGVYVYSIHAGNFVATKKMMLVK